ncbi:LemA family protein [Helicobacter valdiviensis]|uniref:LemA family protein n=1 Tax=Helicobacter valdiviensis TaxID=1458358 RepID=A0A2W6NMF5_9HELI|nr:LemA family protein [Helicobacter valdiviensis]PZT48616.1 LemA family protein [Helicobacter valdiviensis]
MLSVIGILVIIGVLLIFIVNIYNHLIMLYNRVENAFAQIDVQLKRRYDLIPNLVEVAKGYLAHEKDTFIKVAEARNSAKSASENAKLQDPKSLEKLNKAESDLGVALSSFNILIEDYPELKANENLMQLSEELTHTENKISFARQAYNDSATNYNIARQSFPTNIIASFFKRFKEKLSMLEFGEKREELNKAPSVKF